MLLLGSKSCMCITISHGFQKLNNNNNNYNYNYNYNNNKQFTVTTTAKIKANPDYRKITKIVAQSAIAILGLGFLDAGYSGDWSRIGVISKETEDLLKISAFVVLPLCFYLIFSISKISDQKLQ